MKRFSQKKTLRYISAFLLVSTAACVKEVPAVGPSDGGDSVVESPRNSVVAHAPFSKSMSGQSDRAKNALAAVAWIGAGHDSAMQDLIAHRHQWLGNDRSNTRRICEGLVALVAKHGAKADKHTPTPLSAAARNAKAKEWVQTAVAHEDHYSCASIAAMNLFSTPARLRVASADDPAWLSYANSFAAAVDSSDGTPEAVELLGETVLSDASSLGSEDFEMVATIVSLGNSSSETWYNYAVQNNCMGHDVTICEQLEMSLFRMPSIMSPSYTASSSFAPINHKRVLMQDLVWGVFGGLAGGPVGAFWGGVAGSAGSLIDQWLS